jgi:hypothetical protein
MKKYAIVTFLFDNYDLLRTPTVFDPNLDYYCLTDDVTLKDKVWKCIYIPKLDTNTLNGRQKVNIAKNSFYKYLPQEYDWWLCIDGSIQVTGKPSEVIDYLDENGYNIGLAIHPTTMKFMDEYRVWEAVRGCDPKYGKAFRKYAKLHGINPESENGMLECTVKIYKNEEIVLKMIDEIYDTLEEWSDFADLNDQPYITSIFSFYEDKLRPCFFFRQLYYNSKYFEKHHHRIDMKEGNPFTKENTNNYLLGKVRDLKTF